VTVKTVQPLSGEALTNWTGLLKWCARVDERLRAEREGRQIQRGWWDLPTKEG
jgi:hypothetical protein